VRFKQPPLQSKT